MLASAAATGLVWLVCWGLIHGWFPELQRRLVLEALSRSLPLDVELAAVRGSVVDGLVLEALALRPASQRHATPPDQSPPPLTADRIHISLDLTRLFEHRLVIVKSLEVDGVALRIERTSEQQWRLLGTASQSQPRLDREDEPFRIKIEQAQIRNAEVSVRWQDPLGPGHLVARGSVSTRDLSWPNENGRTAAAGFSADFQLIDGALGPLRVQSGQLKLSGSPERLRLSLEHMSGRSADLGHFHLSGSAVIDLASATPAFSNVDARLDFSQLNLAEVDSLYRAAANLKLPRSRLNGELRMSLSEARDPSGPLAASEGQDLRFEFSLDPSHVEALAIDSARARLALQTATGDWRLSEFEVSSRSSRLEGEASGTQGSLEMLSLNAFDLPIEIVAASLGLEADVAGSFDLGARLSGPLRDPLGQLFVEGAVEFGERPPVDFSFDLDLRGNRRFRIESLSLTADGPSEIHFAATAPGEFRQQGDTWVLSDLRLRGLNGELVIAEARTNGRERAIELVLDSLDLQALSRTLGHEVPVEGDLSGPLALVWTADRTRLDADLVWRKPRYAGFVADRIQLNAWSSEASIAIELSIELGGTSPVRISAQLPGKQLGSGLVSLASQPDFSLAFSLRELPANSLASLFAQAGDRAELFAGTISGDFSAAGSNTGLQLLGSASWSDAQFGLAVADDVSLRCRTEAGNLLLDLEISHEGRNGFVAEARIDLANWLERPDAVLRNPRNRASLRAQEIDLGWLVPRASTRRLGRIEDVRGRATGRLSIEGSSEGPQLAGHLRIDDARVRLALVDERVGPINGRLIFSNDEIRLERIEIASKKGPAIVTGHYRWEPLGRDDLRLHVQFEKFALSHFPLLDARVKGELDLTGSLGALDATGELDFSQVRVSLPAPEDPLFREVRILGLADGDAQATDPLGRSRPSAYQSMRAEIAIDVRPGARIRERGADLEVEGQFLLRKKRLSPAVLQGSLRTTRGSYTFLGRKFDVSEAIATFEGRNPPDPELHLVATRQSGEVTVGIERTGRWSAPQSRLISVPEMDESEILSYLVFDKPSAEIGQRDDAQLNAAAAQLAGNFALSQLSRVLSDTLPINEISMGVSEDMTVASVGVETNVGEDIILRYDRALQNGAGDRLSVEWRFWKNLSLRSEYANSGTSGLDLFWSYEY